MVALSILASAGVAQAHEFKPSWGYAFIDDSPFNDPAAGGALMPITEVFPRGFARDVAVDNRDVRLTVWVFTPGQAGSAESHTIDEGDFRNAYLDKRLTIAPRPISYLAYDFCRFNPSNGVVEVCEERHRIGRPEPTPTATPTPTPTATPGGGTQQPSRPVDVDGDGVAVPADCADDNVTVHPGAKEIAGNTIDDDCTGGDAPARIMATIRSKWKAKNGHVWVNRLSVLEAPEGALVEVTCAGQRCPFKRRTAAANARGNAMLGKFFKRKLRPKITIEVRVTYPNTIGRVGRFNIKTADVPNMQRLCLPPGETDPRRC
jgi:hypothetical protein